MIQVRKVLLKDIELLYQNEEELCFDKSIILNKLESMMLVLNGNKLCGIGCCIVLEDKCLINWVYIAKDYRRDHMGTALVKTMLNNAELNGAKTAYMSGNCDQFASYLKFNKINEKDEIIELDKLYQNNYGENYQHIFYKVGLADYFKPCGCK